MSNTSDEWREEHGIASDEPLTDEQYQAYLDDRGITEAEDNAETLAEVLDEYQQETGRTHGFWE